MAALSDKDRAVDSPPSVTKMEATAVDVPPKRSRKETLSAYFTIAAAAFGLIRYHLFST
jgi:hypothetical protein